MIDETTDEGEGISLETVERLRSEAPDQLLIERARQGDQQAFASLFEAYNARICTYLARLVGDDELGRDLAQDTFIAAWRALPQIIGEPRGPTYAALTCSPGCPLAWRTSMRSERRPANRSQARDWPRSSASGWRWRR
jgi:hypothetical protein